MLGNRLKKRYQHLRKWARRSDVTCFRVYERDIPEYPVEVDWYAGEAVVWIHPRKRDETPEQAAAFAAHVLDEVQAGLGLEAGQVFAKQRFRRAEGAQYERLGHANQVRIVDEQGLRFEVNLSDFLDTGLFLDHRTTRALVRSRAAGRRMLNLFAYTGSFTCYAAAGGAAATTTVDLSATYCAWAARNLALNGFEAGPQHRILQADCLAFLDGEARRAPAAYELIVCDPPTFSNSKRMAAASFDVDRDHPRLIARCATLLAPGGELYFSTNSRRFAMLADGSALGLEIAEITEQTVPEDFRNKAIHRCWRMVKV